MPAEIIDLHSRSNDGIVVDDIPERIISGLSLPPNKRQMPTMLLYDERGLQLYDDITTEAPEYYLFKAEEEILKSKADEIVQMMHRGTDLSPHEVIVELGAGALRKTSHILLGLSRLVGESKTSVPITYYALDLEQRELERTLNEIARSDIGERLASKVLTKGMWGTYDDGLKFIESGGLASQKLSGALPTSEESYKFSVRDVSPVSPISSEASMESDSSLPPTPEGIKPPLHIMFLGSSLGNFSRPGAASFLRSLPLRAGSGDTLLIGLDHDNDKSLIEAAYNDPQGYTKRFIFNALKAAGRALGDETMFDEDKWEYTNNYDVAERRHEAFFKSKCTQTIRDPTKGNDVTFLKDELMKIEESLKFSVTDAYSMFAEANLRPVQRWTDSKGQYSLWLLERPPFFFPLLASPTSIDDSKHIRKYSSSPFGIPSRDEWRRLWSAWDFITRRMISSSLLFQKPIDLRHICLFYLGHIPTFLDIHLSKLLQEPHTEPEAFKYIFERGIDPDVDNPEECHPHSEVPQEDDEWPSVGTITKFQTAVRARLMKLYDDIDSGRITLTRKVGRVLFMTLEHEAMHAETLLYMLLQRAGTGTIAPPDFIPPLWDSLKATWDQMPASRSKTVTLGPATVALGHDDDEAKDEDDGLRTAVDGHEFGWDNEHPQRTVQVGEFTIEWRPVTNGEFHRFYVEGGRDKVDFPASWVQDGEKILVRTLYGPVSIEIAQDWPVIAPYNSLSTYAAVKGGRLPTEAELRLFYDKFESGYEGGANVGFRNWHPVPATTGVERDGSKGSNGGVWEWTSTVFNNVEGFVPSKLYPGYSMDFFDGKHQVVLGGSFATIPRISERRSFRNWYQRNYPYPWVGGRIVYDVVRALEKN